MADPLADLSNKGVSIWLDDLSRCRIPGHSVNVNVWDVNDTIQAIVRGGRAVDAARLADVDVPLEEFLG